MQELPPLLALSRRIAATAVATAAAAAVCCWCLDELQHQGPAGADVWATRQKVTTNLRHMVTTAGGLNLMRVPTLCPAARMHPLPL